MAFSPTPSSTQRDRHYTCRSRMFSHTTLLNFITQRQLYYNHGQKSWDTFVFLWHFPIHTGPTPPLTPQTMLDTCIHNFFRVSTLYRVGRRRTARRFRKRCTVLRGNREMTERYEYCSTVPRTFIQDCMSFSHTFVIIN